MIRSAEHPQPYGSYRDVLARSTRYRPDGSPVWPLTDSDRSGMYGGRRG